MELLLQDVIVIFGLSIAVLLLCHRIHLPTIVGYILTGILSGPHGLGLVRGITNVQTLADLGIILLLFIIGIEFSFKRLLENKRFFLLGGFLQVFLTTLGGFIVAESLNRPIGEAVFLGFLLSLSSTAIVMRVYESQRETDSPHGKSVLGILIFQDIIAIPMVLLTPILAGYQGKFDPSFFTAIVKGFVILAVVYIAAERIVPKLFYYIAKTRSRELFLLSVLTICFSVTWIASIVGISLSLGAFLAGLIISESEYRHEAIGDITPFQDIFTSFFFVSIGMLLDLEFVTKHFLLILVLTAGILLLKSSVAGIITLVLGMPLRTAVLTGLALSQIGEFSFVLAKSGIAQGLGTEFHYQLFLSVALLTMAVTPTLIHLGPKLAHLMMSLPFSTKLKTGLESPQPHRYTNHVIIIGFGLSGRNVAQSCKIAGIPYVILEMNPDTVKLEREKGEPIYFGDASHDSLLHHVNIKEALSLAILINDFSASMRIVRRARYLNPHLYIIIRIRYLQEMKILYDLGADDVIPDDFGSSVEIFMRVLKKYHIPSQGIEQIVADLREGYELLRLQHKEPSLLQEIKEDVQDIAMENFKVPSESELINKTLIESELRKNYTCNVVLIKRQHQTITKLEADTKILENDIICLLGSKENLAKIANRYHLKSQKSPH